MKSARQETYFIPSANAGATGRPSVAAVRVPRVRRRVVKVKG